MRRRLLCLAVLMCTPLAVRAQGAGTPDSILQRMYRVRERMDSMVAVSRARHGLLATADARRPIVVAVLPSPLRPAIECPMPVARGRGDTVSQATMDSVAANPPGNAVRIPTIVSARCENPLRR